MGVDITLKMIRDNWNPALEKRNKHSFLVRIFPDCYSEEMCQNSKYVFEYMGESTVGALFRGNRLTLRGDREPAPNFTTHFINGLLKDPELDFYEPVKQQKSELELRFRGNMFQKIFSAVSEMETPSSGNHPLFQSIDFSAVWNGTSEETALEFQRVGEAVTTLLEKPTKATISYAIFLLIVTAIVQDRITEVDILYKPENLEKVYEYENGERLIETPSQKHGPFYNSNYFDHTYHVYAFREASGKLWEECTFRMERQPNGRPEAVLYFKDGMTSPVTGVSAIERTYIGTPMYSPEDNMIVIAMADEKDTFLFLTIPYHNFKFAGMYYRSGFLMKASPAVQLPQVQKIAMTARAVPTEDIPYMEGLLKLDYNQICLSDSQFEAFQNRFKDYFWMKDFKENYIPIFEAHRKKTGLYQLNSQEILSCSMSDLNEENRLRILLALKSMDASNYPNQYKHLLCEDPKETHRIFKYGAKSDPELEER